MKATAQIAFRAIEKRFPGVVALDGVSFEVSGGSCHALMGENGAGKSTLGKILAGIHCPDGGHIELEGVLRRLRSPLEARQAGVGIVHQELSLCPNLSVAENLCLFALPRRGLAVDREELLAQARRFLREVGADCDPQEELGILSTGQTQLVQIAAALATGGIVTLFALLGGVYGFQVATSGPVLAIIKALPSYWLVQAGKTAVGGHDWPAQGWIVIAAWTIVLVPLAVRVYRRDTSRV